MGLPFAEAMEHQLFPALGMRQTCINVPAQQMQHYAQGYDAANAPVRVHPDVLASEAYGVKTTAADLIRFVDAKLGQTPLDDTLRQAIAATHIGYFQAGKMTQDLIWEQYPAFRAGKRPEVILPKRQADLYCVSIWRLLDGAFFNNCSWLSTIRQANDSLTSLH
ncbi:CubicO group peptidase (beta-lactamase class C family) [Duganella sp. HSC-15S17]|nr:CubicO group peptidase (beta-lactamase class C family) [Duganella violaceicalia]